VVPLKRQAEMRTEKRTDIPIFCPVSLPHSFIDTLANFANTVEELVLSQVT